MQRNIVSWPWRLMQNLKKNWCSFKNERNLVNFDEVLEVSKIFTFIGSYCAKYLMFDLKKYRRVIFHYTEEWCKIWRKTNLWFGKWHVEYGRFSPEHLKVSKIFTLMCSFWAKYILFELKGTEELSFRTLNSYSKFE